MPLSRACPGRDIPYPLPRRRLFNKQLSTPKPDLQRETTRTPQPHKRRDGTHTGTASKISGVQQGTTDLLTLTSARVKTDATLLQLAKHISLSRKAGTAVSHSHKTTNIHPIFPPQEREQARLGNSTKVVQGSGWGGGRRHTNPLQTKSRQTFPSQTICS